MVWGLRYSYLDGIPVLSGERVDGLLLEALLALGQSLVPVIKAHQSASLSPISFRTRHHVVFLLLGARASVLKSGQLTHLPTAIFAKSKSQRWSGVVGRVDGWEGDREYGNRLGSICCKFAQVKIQSGKPPVELARALKLAPSRASRWSVPCSVNGATYFRGCPVRGSSLFKPLKEDICILEAAMQLTSVLCSTVRCVFLASRMTSK